MAESGFFFGSKNVSIREWAPKRHVLAGWLVLLTALLSSLHVMAAQEYEEMQQLYRQYMEMPSEQLYRTGHSFLEEGKFDEAMVCFTIVGNRYSPDMTPDEKRICAFALNNAGGICQLRSSYSTAFSYYKKAMRATDDPIHQTYNNIAGIYLFYNDYLNARRYLNQAFDVSLEQRNWESLANALTNIMFLNWRIDSVGQSLPRIAQYVQLDSIPHDSTFVRTLQIANGMRALSARRYADAVRLFVSYNDSLADSNPYQENNATLYIAGAFMKTKDYAKALHYLSLAESETQAAGSMYMLMLVYQMQIDCYEAMGNAQTTRDVRYRLMSLKDSINTAEELEKIKNIEFFHEVDKYEKQVVKLNGEKNSRTMIAYVSIVALVLVLVFLFVAIGQYRQLWQNNKELFRKNDDLVHQADVEKQLRSGYTKKISAYVDEIANLRAKLAQLQPSTPTTDEIGDSGMSESQQLVSEPVGTAEAKACNVTAMTEEQQALILESVYQQLDDVDFISQPDLTVERLAQAIGVHDRYVSQAINEATGKNFNTLLNEYRIREICKRLTDTQHYGTLTNETIAEGLGYKSRSHFTRTFKKITGLTPSQYQKIAKMEGAER